MMDNLSIPLWTTNKAVIVLFCEIKGAICFGIIEKWECFYWRQRMCPWPYKEGKIIPSEPGGCKPLITCWRGDIIGHAVGPNHGARFRIQAHSKCLIRIPLLAWWWSCRYHGRLTKKRFDPSMFRRCEETHRENLAERLQKVQSALPEITNRIKIRT